MQERLGSGMCRYPGTCGRDSFGRVGDLVDMLRLCLADHGHYVIGIGVAYRLRGGGLDPLAAYKDWLCRGHSHEKLKTSCNSGG